MAVICAMQQVLDIQNVTMGQSTHDDWFSDYCSTCSNFHHLTNLLCIDACSSSPDSHRRIQHSWQIQSMALVPHSWWAAWADWHWC